MKRATWLVNLHKLITNLMCYHCPCTAFIFVGLSKHSRLAWHFLRLAGIVFNDMCCKKTANETNSFRSSDSDNTSCILVNQKID